MLEFKDYNNFSLAMCFGRALEMEGEFQVGEKCIATEEPEVMAIEMAKMTDAEICQVTQGGIIPPQGNTNPAKKYNPNPCFRCGLPGHKAVDCPTKDKDKPPEIGGKIHHFLEANTPVDRDLWADFFNKCVKAQAVKKFRRYRKKFQEAVTTAQGLQHLWEQLLFPQVQPYQFQEQQLKGSRLHNPWLKLKITIKETRREKPKRVPQKLINQHQKENLLPK